MKDEPYRLVLVTFRDGRTRTDKVFPGPLGEDDLDLEAQSHADGLVEQDPFIQSAVVIEAENSQSQAEASQGQNSQGTPE